MSAPTNAGAPAGANASTTVVDAKQGACTEPPLASETRLAQLKGPLEAALQKRPFTFRHLVKDETTGQQVERAETHQLPAYVHAIVERVAAKRTGPEKEIKTMEQFAQWSFYAELLRQTEQRHEAAYQLSTVNLVEARYDDQTRQQSVHLTRDVHVRTHVLVRERPLLVSLIRPDRTSANIYVKGTAGGPPQTPPGLATEAKDAAHFSAATTADTAPATSDTSESKNVESAAADAKSPESGGSGALAPLAINTRRKLVVDLVDQAAGLVRAEHGAVTEATVHLWFHNRRMRHPILLDRAWQAIADAWGRAEGTGGRGRHRELEELVEDPVLRASTRNQAGYKSWLTEQIGALRQLMDWPWQHACDDDDDGGAGRDTGVARRMLLRYVLMYAIELVPLTSAGGRPTGMIIDEVLSLMNHSCRPNCLLQPLETGGVKVEMLTQAASGDELCYSYCPTLQDHAPPFRLCDYNQSVHDLRLDFTCRCALCTELAEQQRVFDQWMDARRERSKSQKKQSRKSGKKSKQAAPAPAGATATADVPETAAAAAGAKPTAPDAAAAASDKKQQQQRQEAPPPTPPKVWKTPWQDLMDDKDEMPAELLQHLRRFDIGYDNGQHAVAINAAVLLFRQLDGYDTVMPAIEMKRRLDAAEANRPLGRDALQMRIVTMDDFEHVQQQLVLLINGAKHDLLRLEQMAAKIPPPTAPAAGAPPTPPAAGAPTAPRQQSTGDESTGGGPAAGGGGGGSLMAQIKERQTKLVAELRELLHEQEFFRSRMPAVTVETMSYCERTLRRIGLRAEDSPIEPSFSLAVAQPRVRRHMAEALTEIKNRTQLLVLSRLCDCIINASDATWDVSGTDAAALHESQTGTIIELMTQLMRFDREMTGFTARPDAKRGLLMATAIAVLWGQLFKRSGRRLDVLLTTPYFVDKYRWPLLLPQDLAEEVDFRRAKSWEERVATYLLVRDAPDRASADDSAVAAYVAPAVERAQRDLWTEFCQRFDQWALFFQHWGPAIALTTQRGLFGDSSMLLLQTAALLHMERPQTCGRLLQETAVFMEYMETFEKAHKDRRALAELQEQKRLNPPAAATGEAPATDEQKQSPGESVPAVATPATPQQSAVGVSVRNKLLEAVPSDSY